MCLGAGSSRQDQFSAPVNCGGLRYIPAIYRHHSLDINGLAVLVCVLGCGAVFMWSFPARSLESRAGSFLVCLRLLSDPPPPLPPTDPGLHHLDGRPTASRRLEPDPRRKPQHHPTEPPTAAQVLPADAHIPGAGQPRGRASQQVSTCQVRSGRVRSGQLGRAR